ncbi:MULTISPECIES: hypothetical protein [unclassified Pannonibacter]|uniref:hypothetical protein n=1 Tax=unclassified Pannonibacter TaxID=2627228 RepID=UPI0016474803|nr:MULTISPECIES: hypothetical protein [unclassified Pannonibacter]
MEQPALYFKKLRGADNVNWRISASYQGAFQPTEGYWFTENPVVVMGGNLSQATGRLAQRLYGMRLDERIVAVEYLATVPEEWFGERKDEQKADFVSEFVLWLAKVFGRANIMCVLFGRHAETGEFGAWALVTPVTEAGRLVCGPWFSPSEKHDAYRKEFLKAVRSINPSAATIFDANDHRPVHAVELTVEVA